MFEFQPTNFQKIGPDRVSWFLLAFLNPGLDSPQDLVVTQSDVMVSIVTRHHSSNGQMMSLCSSLLQTTVTTDVFWQSLLCYHCSDMVVVTSRFLVVSPQVEKKRRLLVSPWKLLLYQ
jgi:hypothetical protein